jgi:hypothetical protein
MTTTSNPLRINGVVSTDKSVLQNLNTLATASGCFLTFDINQGKWAVIINKTGSSIASFDDSNIIGSITVSETGVNELYNAVSIEFPHSDISDESDYVELEIDAADRYDNEVDNVLQMQLDCINDPVAAEYLARIELKQNRLSKVIKFTTDFSMLGLKAGDLIDVTSDMYGYTSKVFRITKIEENDEDVLAVDITALEYSADVYDAAGITRKERSKRTGIQLKEQNTELQRLDDVDAGAQLKRLLLGNVAVGLVNNLLNKLFKREIGEDGKPTGKMIPEDQDAEDIDKVLSNAKRPSLNNIDKSSESICEGDTVTITVSHSCEGLCIFDIPDFDYTYEITGVLEEDITIPLTGTVTVSGSTGQGTLAIPTTGTAGGANSQTMSVTIGGLNTSVEVYALHNYEYSTIASTSTITEGQSVTINITTANVANGTTVPYTITGSATGKVSSPALTGTVTVNSNAASLTIVTSDDGAYTSSQSLTFTLDPGIGPCGVGVLDLVAEIVVLDNDPVPPADVSCNYQSVPLIWCGTWDGTTGYLKSVTAHHSVSLPIASAGGTAVPTAVTVLNPNTASASLSITSTVNVDTSAVAGTSFDVITSFGSPGSGPYLTGTTTTVKGY